MMTTDLQTAGNDIDFVIFSMHLCTKASHFDNGLEISACIDSSNKKFCIE